jgi:hypothetical protein
VLKDRPETSFTQPARPREWFDYPPQGNGNFYDLGAELVERNGPNPLGAKGKPEKGMVLVPPWVVVIGFDAEWVREGDGRNRVLSYQWHVITARGEFSGGALMPPGGRVDFQGLVRSSLERAHLIGLLPRFPKTVYLAAHASAADLSHLMDFPKLAENLGAVQKDLVTLEKPITVGWTNAKRNKRKVDVYVRDTKALAAVGGSLAALGKSIGLRKLELPRTVWNRETEEWECPYSKDAMDKFLQEQPVHFIHYAQNDATIAARYFVKLLPLYQEGRMERREPRRGSKAYKKAVKTDFWNNPLMPATLGAWGVRDLLRHWGGTGMSGRRADGGPPIGAEVLGLVRMKKFNPKLNKFTTVQTINAGRERVEDLATRCYHGGRNEAFAHGYSAPGEWFDYDLAGAYTTAMAAMRVADWNKAFPCRDSAQFTANTLGFALVEFEYPEGTRYPGLPVQDRENPDRGLVFPLKGEAYVTAPEIATALWAGARVEIIDGWIVPWAEDEGLEPIRPFAEFSLEIRRRRDEAKARGDRLEDALWKTVGNSVYGKLAQGLDGSKKSFNPATGRNERVGPSRITVPGLAAYTTGLVRAVLAELLHALPPEGVALNAITDGLLTNAKADELCLDGPAARVFVEAGDLLQPGAPAVEVKHEDAQVLVWRTRGHVGVGSLGVQAQGGIQLNGEPDARRAELHKLFRERVPGQKIEETHFDSLRSLVTEDRDLQTVTRLKRLDMDYDFKRRPVEPGEREGLLAFLTEPWRDVEEWRRAFDRRQRWTGKGRLLKTLADWGDFEPSDTLPTAEISTS